MHDHDSNRRRFLAVAGKLGGASWLSLNAPMLLAAGEAAAEQISAGAGWTNITTAQAAGLGAVANQIIPPDDLPGAADAGVVHFIDNVLGGFAASMAVPLKEGLEDLDQRAIESFGGEGGFAALPFDRQTGILHTVEDSSFFKQMIFLTHCGMFAMPSWGGNRAKAGWSLLGFENLHAWHPPFGYYDGLAMKEEERT